MGKGAWSQQTRLLFCFYRVGEISLDEELKGTFSGLMVVWKDDEFLLGLNSWEEKRRLRLGHGKRLAPVVCFYGNRRG